MLNKATQRGLSIIEILVMLLIAGVIISASLSIFTQSLSVSSQVINQGKLNRDLNAAMNTMVADIQRAGYWGNATASASNNPFMAPGLDIAINESNDCIIFTYDRNGNGMVAPINPASDDEHYGFRRTSGGVLQFRPPGATFTCNAPNDWVNITDINIVTITAFSVTLIDVPVSPSGGADRTHYRSVILTITGQLTSDANITVTLSRTVKIYNNKFTP